MEKYFSNFFFQNFQVLGTPGVPIWVPLGVKTTKMIFCGSNFFSNGLLGLKQEDWHQDSPLIMEIGQDMAF